MIREMIFGVFFVLATLCAAHAATIYVPDDYTTIQAATDASANGYTIIVRPGTYVENIDFVGKAITVKSELGAAVINVQENSPFHVL
jgi:hypothetical protein